ncbi:multicopper oxidase family protein [Clostridium folliculivorans]|uniref:Multicopper oxidase mco n=1 Tax=Clostridium folliculivorans TaxID=2886038 RepID=A0A9W5Y137_9CLOT|nr:multicopper oxidase domain-containing protein [Clostridium folliculivorans]GKU24567.1 multicopper oxidase mco [Clostridium folliculivorans]GKU30665.1 multicopper oxidase mco [Clostridium folliculivorans]
MIKTKNISTVAAVVAGVAAAGFIIFANPINKNKEMSTTEINNINKKAKINNSLPIPALLEDKNPDPKIDDFTLEPQQGLTSFIAGTQTKTMGYNGNFLGPVIRVNKGDQVNIHVNNKLNEATTVHWHGVEVNGENDGGPDQAIKPGTTWNPSFTINQQAATLWYHPHFSGTTATQVYSGLAGLFYVDDEVSKSLNIPKDYGINDIPLVIQDRSFNKDGSFKYDTNMMDGATGNNVIVNGAVKPYLDVKKVKIRLRIVNGSNASNFNLNLDNKDDFYQIASDGGFLESPVRQKSLFLAPGERAEIIIDFSKYDKGTKVSLINDKTEILSFNVKEDGNDTTEIPDVLTKVNKIEKSQATKVRNFDLQGMGNMVSINGQKFDMNRIDETVKQGDTEIWNITSEEAMMHNMGHPFHIHGVQFQILSRDGKEPDEGETGWKDTVYIKPNEKVSIIVKFNNKGTFMYHCHILEHEESGMMGQIKVE